MPVINPVDEGALWRAVMEASVDAIIVSDRNGNILRLNSSAAKLFGRSVEELINENVRVLMPNDMAARHDGFLQRHLSTGEKQIIGIGRDVEGLRADGTTFPLHLSVGRADVEGDVAFVAILHDLTQRQAAAESAARSQRIDAIGQMTGGIAHDFNNLLTVVTGNLELMQMAQSPANNEALIADALEAAELGADLTSRLMVFARKSNLKAEVMVLNDAVEQSLAILKRTIRAQTVMSAALASELWHVKADGTQLQTAVMNLALNAQDAMPNGGKIFFETRNISLDDAFIAQEIGIQPGNYVRLSVSDSGEGMSDETRKRALEPFYTTKPIGKGTGLGLSTVYGFVTQSGGYLTIYSELGEGTTVNIYFPAVFSENAGMEPAALPAEQSSGLGSDKLVLIVEDDPRVMRASEARMAALGFNCITATTADDAWEVLQERDDIRLVFTDLMMPGTMSGYDLAKRIAASKPQIRVLMTSGFAESILKDGATGSEFSMLRKPYRQADLIQALQQVLTDD